MKAVSTLPSTWTEKKNKREKCADFLFSWEFPMIQLLIMNCHVAWSKLYLHLSFFSDPSLICISRFLLKSRKISSKCQGKTIAKATTCQSWQRCRTTGSKHVWSHGSTLALHRMETLCHSKTIYDLVYVTGHIFSWLSISSTELRAQRSSMTGQMGRFLDSWKLLLSLKDHLWLGRAGRQVAPWATLGGKSKWV